MVVAERSAEVQDVDCATLRDWLAKDEAVLVDVREKYEHASGHIDAAQLHPLSAFDADELRQTYAGKRIVFQCRSGNRSRDAANRFRQGDEPVYHLAGGIEAWKSAGLPVTRSAGAPTIDIMRQVQMTAGSLVLIGVLLGAFISPWFLILSGFVGGGLLFAGASGWCGMAKLLGAMPWNRVGSEKLKS